MSCSFITGTITFVFDFFIQVCSYSGGALWFPRRADDHTFHNELGQDSKLSGQARWYTHFNVPQSRSGHSNSVKAIVQCRGDELELYILLFIFSSRNHMGLLHAGSVVFWPRAIGAWDICSDLRQGAFLRDLLPIYACRLIKSFDNSNEIYCLVVFYLLHHKPHLHHVCFFLMMIFTSVLTDVSSSYDLITSIRGSIRLDTW